MAIVAIGIEILMICPLISTTEKVGRRHDTPADKFTGHAAPVKPLSGGMRCRFNGPTAIFFGLQART
jgi:hypothetical protein